MKWLKQTFKKLENILTIVIGIIIIICFLYIQEM
jgi:hypothetical protein